MGCSVRILRKKAGRWPGLFYLFFGSFSDAFRAMPQPLGLGNVASRTRNSGHFWRSRSGRSGSGRCNWSSSGRCNWSSSRSGAGWGGWNSRTRGDNARIEGGAAVGAWSAAHDYGAGNSAFADDGTAVDGRARATAIGDCWCCFASAARSWRGCAAWCRGSRATGCLAGIQLGQQSTAVAFLLGVQSGEQASAATALRATVAASGRQRPEARNDKGHSGQCNHSQTNHSKHPPERTRNTDPRKTQIHANTGVHILKMAGSHGSRTKAGVARPSLGRHAVPAHREHWKGVPTGGFAPFR